MNNKHLLTWLALVVVAAGLGKPGDGRTGQRADVLAAIFEAFAWNLAADGQQERPRLTTAGDVGRVLDDFGRRSTLGISYKKTFSAEFSRLGADLSAAAGGGKDAAAAPLTVTLRAQMVAIFKDHARQIK